MTFRGSRRLVVLGLFGALLLGPPVSLRAEVAAEPHVMDVGVLILGIIEGPDPIPQVIWEPIRDVDPALILNPDGAGRGDGRPDVATDPVTGSPHVVWAYNNGTDFDIAYSRWDQDTWLAPVFLTADTGNHIDPRIHATDEAVYVVWWESSGALWFAKKPRLQAWAAPELVTTQQPSFRPSVLFWEGELLIAAEREVSGGNDREIFLSTRIGPSNYISQSVAIFMTNQPLDVILHGENGKLWMDWCESPTSCAYSIREGADWSAPVDVPSTGTSWLDKEQTRLLIRSQVLASP